MEMGEERKSCLFSFLFSRLPSSETIAQSHGVGKCYTNVLLSLMHKNLEWI